jgi:hypothetical protein
MYNYISITFLKYIVKKWNRKKKPNWYKSRSLQQPVIFYLFGIMGMTRLTGANRLKDNPTLQSNPYPKSGTNLFEKAVEIKLWRDCDMFTNLPVYTQLMGVGSENIITSSGQGPM